MRDILDDLGDEFARIEALLAALTDEQWRSPSAAPGWSVADVVLHLAQTEEHVVGTIRRGSRGAIDRSDRPNDVDGAMDRLVAAERAEPPVVFERWRVAHRAALDALRAADPDVAVGWAAAPLRPRTLATTRLAEHWAHMLDIAGPLDLSYPDTARLWHVARLGFRTLPYGFRLRGEEVPEVFCELYGPDGSTWTFGDPAAPSLIRGDAGAFCRVGAQRLAPADSGLDTSGPFGAAALAALRNYAA